jgi:hypothetical protein
MSALFALVPLPYRLAFYAVCAAGLIFFGFVKGLRHGEAGLEAYRASVALTAAAQEQSSARVMVHQKEVSDNVAKDYEARLAALRASFGGVRTTHASPGVVPAVSQAAVCAAGGPADLVSTEQYRQLEADAAQVTLQYVELREWITQQAATSNAGAK